MYSHDLTEKIMGADHGFLVTSFEKVADSLEFNVIRP